MALPSVRHAAAELLTLAVSRVSSASSQTAATPTPTAVRAKDLGLGSIITITPIITGANGERCAVLFANALVVDLKIPSNDDLCKVRVQWYLADVDRTSDISIIRERAGNAVDLMPQTTKGSVLPQSGELIQELSPAGLMGYTYLLRSRQFLTNNAAPGRIQQRQCG